MATKPEIVLLVGTKKGGFILTSDRSRKDWSLTGPHAMGREIFHMTYDPRDGSVLAAVNHMIWGHDVQRSNDLGATWESAETVPSFDDGGDLSVERVWHLEPGRASEPGVVYAGVEPAALFRSEDGGANWTEVSALSSHPTREEWQPGLGGLCLHSILPDVSASNRMWVGISAVGVFRSNDAGETWDTRNKGVRADFMPDRYPEYGQCPHKLLAHPDRPEVLFQQNHCGVYRSDNGGDQWTDITGELPSRFGFVLGLHSQDPETLYVMPEDQATGDEAGGFLRYVSGAQMRVFRSRNSGEDWEPLTNGLPQSNAYVHSMREGMATDGLDPCGIYVGLASGKIFHSRDDGDTWEVLVDNLPSINSVEIGMVG